MIGNLRDKIRSVWGIGVHPFACASRFLSAFDFVTIGFPHQLELPVGAVNAAITGKIVQ